MASCSARVNATQDLSSRPTSLVHLDHIIAAEPIIDVCGLGSSSRRLCPGLAGFRCCIIETVGFAAGYDGIQLGLKQTLEAHRRCLLDTSPECGCSASWASLDISDTPMQYRDTNSTLGRSSEQAAVKQRSFPGPGVSDTVIIIRMPRPQLAAFLCRTQEIS